MRTRRQLLARIFQLVSLGCVTLVLAACGQDLPASTLDPHGDHARRIYEDLLVPIFWMALAVFVIVEALLLFAVIRFRQKPDGGMPAQIHGNTRIEIAWTIIPAVIVTVIAIFTYRTQAMQSTIPQNAIPIEVVGRQWWWEFRYPTYLGEKNLPLVTANDLYIPVGQPVRLDLRGADVIHSFWIPKLAGKTDAIPGKVNYMSFTAEREGIYRGFCAEFCGEEHALMRFRVIAVSPETFQRWVEQHNTPPAPPTAGDFEGGDPARGALVFEQKLCVTCHAVAGNPKAVGVSGPNLTYFGSRETIAAGTLKNTPENMAKWLRNPQAVKPGNLMATIIKEGTLSDQEIKDLIAYLYSMKISIEKPAER